MPQNLPSTFGLRRPFRLAAQALVMVFVIGLLLWYVGIEPVLSVISKVKLEYLALAFLSYLCLNLLFTFRLLRVFKREGLKTSFAKTLMAQYAGMLTSDVTPGKSGYILMPFYLMDQGVPTSLSLSAVLGIQSVEFLVKVLGGAVALFFLIENAVYPLSTAVLLATSIGICLMLAGGILFAAMSWSERVIKLFNRVANSRFLSRFTGRLASKVEEYRDSSRKTQKAFPEIVIITFACWIVKGFEWYFLGLALGITKISWFGFFLMHPLVTALGFVPLTPSGAGFQEGATVGVFWLLGVDQPTAFAFALLSRVLLLIEDFAGLPRIVQSASKLFPRKRQTATRDSPAGT
jgi:uncharacterized protein (TIRG00374 family)